MTEKNKKEKVINLGCGNLIISGAENVDKAGGVGVIEKDVFDYLRDVPLDYAKEIHVYYLLEHMSLTELLELTYLMNNVLILGGKVKGIVPDCEEIISRFPTKGAYFEKIEWFLKYHYEICGTKDETLHATCWSEDFLKFIFKRDGFKITKIEKHVGSKNVGLYFEATKVEHLNWRLKQGEKSK